jgi:hypothetical protein
MIISRARTPALMPVPAGDYSNYFHVPGGDTGTPRRLGGFVNFSAKFVVKKPIKNKKIGLTRHHNMKMFRLWCAVEHVLWSAFWRLNVKKLNKNQIFNE